jgi:uncharacterized integral membrane protein (TIGR00697 family)
MNEIVFFTFAILCLSVVLLAFRLGKIYLFAAASVLPVLMNIFVLKQFDLFGYAVTGGNVLYGALFLTTDLLSEHYGKKEALRAVRLGFFVSAFFVISLQFLLTFVPNGYDFAQSSLQTLFSLSPRILFASMVSYIIVQHMDVYIYDALRKRFVNKLWVRNLGSTLISQAVDTIIFTILGLLVFTKFGVAGVVPLEALTEVLLVTYAIKIIVALIDTPFIYLSKRIKHE